MNPVPEEEIPSGHPGPFLYEYSDYYKPLWIRRDTVVCAGPEDRSPVSDCKHEHCGVRFPHTTEALTQLAWMWGGENGAN